MMPIDDFAEPATRHVRVYLRGRNISVPQHDLHAAQIRAPLYQVSGETVPHHVRRQLPENSYTTAMCL